MAPALDQTTASKGLGQSEDGRTEELTRRGKAQAGAALLQVKAGRGRGVVTGAPSGGGGVWPGTPGRS